MYIGLNRVNRKAKARCDWRKGASWVRVYVYMYLSLSIYICLSG